MTEECKRFSSASGFYNKRRLLPLSSPVVIESALVFSAVWEVINQKPNTRTYKFIGVSGHNLESCETWGFCMDFLNHREGGVVTISFSSFLLYRNCKRFREFGEIEIPRQSCTGEKQGGKLWRLLSGFRPRIGLSRQTQCEHSIGCLA